MVVGPKQRSLGIEAVWSHIRSLKMKASDDSEFRSRGSHLFGFSLYFYLQEKKKNKASWMLSAAQQSFDSCWEEFPVISQNNSLVIIPCDRQTVCLASNVFRLWSSVWDGWVKGSPWAQEELAPSLGQWYWRGRGCQRQSTDVGEPLLDSSCSGDREKPFRTRHCFLQKGTDGRSKAWEQGPACRRPDEGKIGFHQF